MAPKPTALKKQHASNGRNGSLQEPLPESRSEVRQKQGTVGAVILRTGLWGPSNYNYNKEPHNSIGNEKRATHIIL